MDTDAGDGCCFGAGRSLAIPRVPTSTRKEYPMRILIGTVSNPGMESQQNVFDRFNPKLALGWAFLLSTLVR